MCAAHNNDDDFLMTKAARFILTNLMNKRLD